jgi:hypothetical protein
MNESRDLVVTKHKHSTLKTEPTREMSGWWKNEVGSSIIRGVDGPYAQEQKKRDELVVEGEAVILKLVAGPTSPIP